MSRKPIVGGAVYGLYNKPIGATPWRTMRDMFRDRPVCRLFFPIDGEAGWDGAVSVVCGLPAGDNIKLPSPMLAALIAAADAGEAIAFHGTSEIAIACAMDAVATMTGGGHG